MPYIKRIKIQHLRNLTDITLECSPSVNILFGKNGSGKSSLLEAITLLGLGKSFRTHKSKNIIQHEHEKLTVFGELDSQSGRTIGVGIQKDKKGSTSLKIDGENAYSSSLLAKNLPLQLVNAKSFQLLEGSSQQRRQFLDWMVFHVKPDFIQVWVSLQKIIKHRNSILRHDKITMAELLPWDTEFLRLAKILDCLRHEVFQEFKAALTDFVTQHTDFEIEYYCGWNSEKLLKQVLTETLDKDCRAGYTHHGPHRADLKIKVGNKNAVDLLSRGQEKSLVCGLHIGQVGYYQLKLNKNCIFLVDDMLSELDTDHQNRLANWLFNLNCQIFVTGVDEEKLLDIWKKIDTDIAVFHVEHGDIAKVC